MTDPSDSDRPTGTFTVKRGLAEMLRGGVIMDVVDAEQAKVPKMPVPWPSWPSSVCRPTSDATAAWPG